MNGQMDTDFGRVLILTSKAVRTNCVDMFERFQLNIEFASHACCSLDDDNFYRSIYRVGKEFRETCSGHGKHLASRCKCDKKYYGSRCQYADECVSDDDCGSQGKCIDLQGSSMPRRQCFCNFGWFGPNCAKSEYSMISLVLFLHKKKIESTQCMPLCSST